MKNLQYARTFTQQDVDETILYKNEKQGICIDDDDKGLVENDKKQQNYKSYSIKMTAQPMKINNISNNNITNQKVDLLIGLVTDSISGKISTNDIEVSNQPQNLSKLNLKKSSVHSLQKSDEKRIAEIIKKRKQLEDQMARLKYQQEQQKLKKRALNPEIQITTHTKTFRSYFTQKQQTEISRIKKQSSEFQSKLSLKQKQLEQKLQLERLQQLTKQNLLIQKLKDKKKHQILKNMQKLQSVRTQRSLKIQQQNKQYNKIRQQRSLHYKIHKYHQGLNKLKQIKQKQILENKRKQMMLNIQQIKKHQRKYYQKLKIQKEKMQEQLNAKLREMRLKEEQDIYKPSAFLNTIFREQQIRQQEERERIQRLKEMYHKKNTFQEKLRQKHKQSIKPKVNQEKNKERLPIQQKAQLRREKAKSLTALDIYRLGNQNMKKIHQNIAPTLIEQNKLEMQQSLYQIRLASTSNKFTYPDYLKQSRIKREMFLQSHHVIGNNNENSKIRVNPENKEIRELKNLILTEKDRGQKLFQAKLISQRLDGKLEHNNNKFTDTKAMINSIAAKIKIIEEFS